MNKIQFNLINNIFEDDSVTGLVIDDEIDIF